MTTTAHDATALRQMALDVAECPGIQVDYAHRIAAALEAYAASLDAPVLTATPRPEAERVRQLIDWPKRVGLVQCPECGAVPVEHVKSHDAKCRIAQKNAALEAYAQLLEATPAKTVAGGEWCPHCGLVGNHRYGCQYNTFRASPDVPREPPADLRRKVAAWDALYGYTLPDGIRATMDRLLRESAPPSQTPQTFGALLIEIAEAHKTKPIMDAEYFRQFAAQEVREGTRLDNELSAPSPSSPPPAEGKPLGNCPRCFGTGSCELTVAEAAALAQAVLDLQSGNIVPLPPSTERGDQT